MKKKFLIITLLLVLLCGCKKEEDKTLNDNKVNEQPETKEVTIVDLDSKERPIAVMINTHKDARPQAGLSDAFIVYELMVEGGITRMLALYTQDFDEEKIGSVRSSRHYYLDYLLENDAIYIHWGGSNPAYEDLEKLDIDRIDGMVYGNKYFTTDSSLKRSLEHTRFTSSSLIKEGIEKLKLRTTTDSGYLLNYTGEVVDLSKNDGTKANDITIKYSSYQTINYKYDKEEQVYYRYMSGEKHTDLVTGEQYKFKNIIAYDVDYNSYNGHKTLRDIDNLGEGTGVYITNGYSIPIKWSKDERSSKTKYMYMNGTEIEVSDGNTFIQIYPKDGKLTIK